MVLFLKEDGVTERAWQDVPMPWYAKLLWWLLSFAELPSSLVLAPDGNRRWAKQRGLSPQEGHTKGTVLIEQFLAAALALRTKSISVYVFSVNNFNRPPDQRDQILNYIKDGHENICKNWQLYRKKGWSVKVPGDIELFPKEVSKHVAKAELLTHQKGTQSELFYCEAYASRHQVTRMALRLCHAVREGVLEPGDINEHLIDLYNEIEDCPKADCYLRTSGEHRLSDFQTWQAERSAIYFENKNLPDFGFWDMFKMMLHYSASSSARKHLEGCYVKARNKEGQTCSATQRLKERKFQSWLEAKRQAYLHRLVEDDP